MALDFPDLTIVGGHIGYPWTTEMVALATKYPNVHIDRLRLDDEARELFLHGNAARILPR